MCFHKWKYYKDMTTEHYYRVCTKCGIAQEAWFNEYDMSIYKTDPTLCRTNNWISRDMFRLRYDK